MLARDHAGHVRGLGQFVAALGEHLPLGGLPPRDLRHRDVLHGGLVGVHVVERALDVLVRDLVPGQRGDRPQRFLRHVDHLAVVTQGALGNVVGTVPHAELEALLHGAPGTQHQRVVVGLEVTVLAGQLRTAQAHLERWHPGCGELGTRELERVRVAPFALHGQGVVTVGGHGQLRGPQGREPVHVPGDPQPAGQGDRGDQAGHQGREVVVDRERGVTGTQHLDVVEQHPALADPVLPRPHHAVVGRGRVVQDRADLIYPFGLIAHHDPARPRRGDVIHGDERVRVRVLGEDHHGPRIPREGELPRGDLQLPGQQRVTRHAGVVRGDPQERVPDVGQEHGARPGRGCEIHLATGHQPLGHHETEFVDGVAHVVRAVREGQPGAARTQVP